VLTGNPAGDFLRRTLLADLLTGSFVVKPSFKSGIGAFYQRLFSRDYSLVIGLVMLYAVLLVLLNLALGFCLRCSIRG
jgi:ABC-type dipeptide/oligopeptide/nickel transport system permease component